ncbi:uncharacterized protein [Bactrocera oleae]|uniref:uncharacterized protein n=1 Tax=Bactrocera oleae TaxID=104688 RepID=UPI00387E310C
MSLDELRQRASTKKNITRIKNIVDASLRPGGKALLAAEYKCRLGILESYFKQIHSIQTDIERLDADDSGRADPEELYITTKLSRNITQRFDHAKKIGLWINCISKGHRVANCPSSHRCKVCARQHHSLLHRVSTSDQQTPTQVFTTQEAVAHTHKNNSSLDNVIHVTAKIFVRDASGSYRLGTALLDSCSQVHFITDDFSQKLLLPRNKQNIQIQSIGSSSTNIKFKTSTNIKSQVTGFEHPSTFCITSHIAYQPDSEHNIALADDKFYIPKKIDMSGHRNVLQSSICWIVSGRYTMGSNNISKPSCLFLANESLNAKLEKLWKLEEIPTIPEAWTREQQSCEHIYNSTVSKRPCGRIVVKLPFKDDPTCLCESYTTALRRFNAQERRLAKSPQLKEQYVEFISDYESLGHMSVVKNPNLSEPHYYIPHHCVLKPTSTTTKLRVVFDASCQTTSQNSLNDIQMVFSHCRHSQDVSPSINARRLSKVPVYSVEEYTN